MNTPRLPAARLQRIRHVMWLWGVCLIGLLISVYLLYQQRQTALQAWQTAHQQAHAARVQQQQQAQYAEDIAWGQAWASLQQQRFGVAAQATARRALSAGQTRASTGAVALTEAHAQAYTASLLAVFQRGQRSTALAAMHYAIQPPIACDAQRCAAYWPTANPPALPWVIVPFKLSWQMTHEASMLAWLAHLQQDLAGQLQLQRCQWQGAAMPSEPPNPLSEQAAAASPLATPVTDNGLTAECQLYAVFFPTLWSPATGQPP